MSQGYSLVRGHLTVLNVCSFSSGPGEFWYLAQLNGLCSHILGPPGEVDPGKAWLGVPGVASNYL